ncbi:MAG: ABC transporter permease subunit [Oscillospiraceae bacterium]|nr:ABC transporter permease subunit [Oscillospiraceae bacterium]
MVRKWWHTAAAILFWVLVWHLGAMAVNRTLLLPVPTPADTAAALIRLGSTRDFWLTVCASLLRIGTGFLLAVAAGTAGAALAVRWRLWEIAAEPLLRLIRAVPVASVTILVFLWVSREHIPTFIAFLTVLPVIWSNVESGLRQTDRSLVEMAQVFGMRRREILHKITLPSLRPYFTAAVATGLGFAWKSGVAAEIICRADSSLGNLLWGSKNAVDYDEVFALTLVIVVWSVALETLARRFIKGGRR